MNTLCLVTALSALLLTAGCEGEPTGAPLDDASLLEIQSNPVGDPSRAPYESQPRPMVDIPTERPPTTQPRPNAE